MTICGSYEEGEVEVVTENIFGMREATLLLSEARAGCNERWSLWIEEDLEDMG